jgi:TatD DNase family protein
MFFDAHAHLDMMNENEIKEIINSKINKIMTASTSFQSNQKNLELSKKYEKINCAIGLYPLDALELNEKMIENAFNYFEELLKKEKISAIGEVGLDHKYSTEKEKQKEIFIRFIELAKKYDKPLIIHSRYAQRTVLDILEKENVTKALLHSFIDSKKLINHAIQKNYFISIGPIILHNQEVEKRFMEIEFKNIFFETDSPIKFGQDKITPINIINIAEKFSEIKEIPIKEIKRIHENYYKKLFQ